MTDNMQDSGRLYDATATLMPSFSRNIQRTPGLGELSLQRIASSSAANPSALGEQALIHDQDPFFSGFLELSENGFEEVVTDEEIDELEDDDDDDDEIQLLDPEEARAIFAAASAARPTKKPRIDLETDAPAPAAQNEQISFYTDVKQEGGSKFNQSIIPQTSMQAQPQLQSQAGTSSSVPCSMTNPPVPTWPGDATQSMIQELEISSLGDGQPVPLSRLRHPKHDHPSYMPKRCLALSLPTGRRPEVKPGDLQRWAVKFGKVGHVCMPSKSSGLIFFGDIQAVETACRSPGFSGVLLGSRCHFVVDDGKGDPTPQRIQTVVTPKRATALEPKSTIQAPIPPFPFNNNLFQVFPMGGLPPLPFVAPYMSSEIYRELIPPPKNNKRKLDIAFAPEPSSSTSSDTQRHTKASANLYNGSSELPLPETASSQPSTSSMQIDSHPLAAGRPTANSIPAATILSPSIPELGSSRPLPSSHEVIDLTRSSPDIQMQPPSAAVNNIEPLLSQGDISLSNSSNSSELRPEIVSSESETSASSTSVHSGSTSLSSAPSEDVMQFAEAFIQSAICGKQSSGGAVSGSMSVDTRRQYLEEKIRLVKEELSRKRELEAAAARAKKNSHTDGIPLRSQSNIDDTPRSETSNPRKDEQLPALPTIANRERLLSAQISRMTILLQKLKIAVSPEDKSRITKLVRRCEDEYQTRVSALPPISSCTAVSSSSAQFIWPSYMETEIWISDDEDE